MRTLIFLTVMFLFGNGFALNVGDEAPVIKTKDHLGEKIDTARLKGKKNVVVYFYPANFTPGCTKQACNYRDRMGELNDKDTVVLGVSGNHYDSHKDFMEVYKLNFSLLADKAGKLAKAFDVPYNHGKKSSTKIVEGKKVKMDRDATIRRWTFLIDKSGKIAYINDKVKAAKDADSILAQIDKLKN